MLYKDVLSAVNPSISIKEIAKSVSKGNGKTYTVRWMRRLLSQMFELKLVRKVIDEPKCIRYERTGKGERLVKAESLDKIKG